MQIVPSDCVQCVLYPDKSVFLSFLQQNLKKVKYRPISCFTVHSVFLANSAICPKFPDHGNRIVVRGTISMRGRMNKCALSAQCTDSDKIYLLH